MSDTNDAAHDASERALAIDVERGALGRTFVVTLVSEMRIVLGDDDEPDTGEDLDDLAARIARESYPDPRQWDVVDSYAVEI